MILTRTPHLIFITNRFLLPTMIFVLLAALIAGPQMTLPLANVRIKTTQGQVAVTAQMAQDAPSWSKGLMERTHMPPNEGMLFIFPKEEQRSFWMENTPLSLDMIFINRHQKIVAIIPHTPPNSTTVHNPRVPSQFVLEVHSGFCKKHGIQQGNTVTWGDRAH